MHNGLNDTQEIPVMQPEQPMQNPPQFPENTLNPPQYPTESPEFSDDFLNQQQEFQSQSGAFTQTAEIPIPPPSQTIYSQSPSPPPRQPIRRASMTTPETPEEPVTPYRRPPQQKKKPIKRESAESEPKKKRKKRKKRKSCIGRLIASVITFLLVIFAIYSVIAVSIAKKFQYQDTGTRHLEKNSIAIHDDGVKNYLLIGTTARQTEKGKADSIHLISISSHNHSFTFTTISPNCLINIPTLGDGLLKDAYSNGGATLLMDTITNEFGIPIDNYFCIGFSAFANIADSLGGLKVKISETEMQQMNELLKDEFQSALKDISESDILKSSGELVLNGKQLLAYSQLQDKANEALQNLPNQQDVWNGLLEKMKNMDFSTAKKIAKEALPIVTTNLDTLELYGLSLKLPYHLIKYDFQSLSLPHQGTFHQTKANGNQVLTIDYDANLRLFHDAMVNPIVKLP